MQQPMRIATLLLGLVLGLAGCAAPVSNPQVGLPSVPATPAPTSKNFQEIRDRVEPMAERFCRSTPGTRNCDFIIRLDPRTDRPPNAFQTLTSEDRPLLIVNQTLIDQLQNADEIAFVIAHEAAHHIEDHILKQQLTSYNVALKAGLAAAALGASPEVISEVQRAGAFTGSRIFSKSFELQADSMGAEIAYYAGYDPVKGAAYFTRAKDPGNVYLGTHPPNADRIKAVRDTMAALR